MEPGGAGEELVGEGVGLEEVDEALELGGIFGVDVGGLAKKVLRVFEYEEISGEHPHNAGRGESDLWLSPAVGACPSDCGPDHH